ncbi:hypothetical protein CSB20_03745 [bacterium DOLZORAL124_64_63]|nr:MAG: hypothetical protein CSB20_03745 [bacterium DOLZORAL124_64_63]
MLKSLPSHHPKPGISLIPPILILLGLLPGPAAASPQPAPCHGAPAALAEDSSFPPPAAHDRGIDVLSYDLVLDLDPQERRLTGEVAIGMVALVEGLTRVHLDLVDELTCLAIVQGGRPAVFTHGGDSLLVDLAAPLSTTRPETLRVRYEGRPPAHGSFRAGLMFRRHSAGTNGIPEDDMPIIANVSETWSAHSWWPCKDHPHDKARVSLTASVPDTLSVVSNGTLEQMDTPEPGRRRYRWREAYPLPTYLVSLAASDYVSWQTDCPVRDGLGGATTIDLGFHVFPFDREDAQVDFAVTCDAMAFLTELLGPYPFAGEKYDQVEIKWGGAMEHPTASSMPTYMFGGTGALDVLVVHEMAHQWFGNSLTPAAWHDIWLNEGFARYCEALWLEHAEGPAAYADFMRTLGPGHHPDLFVGDGRLGDPDPILPNLLVYDKGAWLLHSLRLLLGDDAFFRLLLSYANDPALVHGHATSADFQAHAEAIAGRGLERFFHAWLQTEMVPRLGVSVARNGTQAEITLQQLQDPWLPMAVPVVLHDAAGDARHVLVLDQRQRRFTLEAQTAVDAVSVDPDGMVLMLPADAPAPALDVQGPWPNPASGDGDGVRFAIRLLETADLEVRLHDARGRLVLRTRTGPLEATGPQGPAHSWTWEMPADGSLASGVYWLEFRGLGRRAVRKLTLLR